MDYHDALMRRLSMIQDLGTNATRLAQMQAQSRPQPNPMAGMPGLKQVSMPQYGGGGKGGFQDFVRAISGQESGGNYGAVNPHTGAMGKYQIMPSNIQGQGQGWDYQALGRDVSVQQFLSSPQIQEAVAQYQLQNYYNKYGAAGAAVAWYAGPGTVSGYMKNPQAYTNPQGQYPSIANYVNSVLGRM